MPVQVVGTGMLTTSGPKRSPRPLPPKPPQPDAPHANKDRFDRTMNRIDGFVDAGKGVDYAVDYASAVKESIKDLGNMKVPLHKRIALPSKIVRDVDRVRDGATDLGHGVTEVDQMVAKTHGEAGKLARKSLQEAKIVDRKVAKPYMRPLGQGLQIAGAVGTVSYAVLSGPDLVKDAKKDTQKLVKTLRDPKATPHKKEDALVDASYSIGGLLYGVSAIPGAFDTLSSVGPKGLPLHKLGQAVVGSKAYHIADKTTDVLYPVADGLYLVGDSAYLAKIRHEDDTTKGDKVRAGFDIGLDAARLASDAFPNHPVARVVHATAGVTQLGLSVYDYVKAKRDKD